MIGNFPGKILFFDDREKDVKDHIQAFRKDGYGVKYFSSLPDVDDIPSNVRLVVTDLDLDNCGEVTDEDIELLIEYLVRVKSKTSFFLISIFSGVADKDFNENVDRIKEKYEEITGKKIQAEFLTPLKKSEYKTKLKATLEKWIQDNSHSGVIIEWEKTIEEARDVAVSSIVNAGEIRLLLHSLNEESSKEALTREILQLFNRILLRHSCQVNNSIALDKCVQSVISNETPLPEGLSWYSNIHFLNNYYFVKDEEPSTGDIYCTTEGESLKKYAIITTPVCDIAQKKSERTKIVYGWSIEKITDYSISDNPELIPEIVKVYGKDSKGKYYPRSEIIQKITTKSRNLPERFFLMHFIQLNEEKKEYTHILFDFQNSCSIVTIPYWWDRLCRVDSPQIDLFMQKYAAYSSRLGVCSIPENILKSESERISKLK
jgi:hypothetical protein